MAASLSSRGFFADTSFDAGGKEQGDETTATKDSVRKQVLGPVEKFAESCKKMQSIRPSESTERAVSTLTALSAALKSQLTSAKASTITQASAPDEAQEPTDSHRPMR